MPDPILLTAYSALQDDFKSTHAYQSVGNPLRARHADFPFADLSALIPSGNPFAVVIYFGLLESDLRYGIRIVEMKATADPAVFELDPILSDGVGQSPSHIVDNGTLLPIGSFTKQWSAMRDAYYANVVVSRAGDGTFAALNPMHDPKATVLSWREEVLALWNDNQIEIGDLPSRVMISSLARNHTGNVGYNGPDGYRHSAGLHIQVNVRGTWTDLLDDSNTVPPTYRNHGADFGNACPPMCAEFSAANP